MRRWMIVVGVYFLVMGVRLLPWINGPMIEAMGMHESVFTGGGFEPGTAVFAFMVDWMATFGAALIPLGAVLLVGARAPRRNRLLVHLAIWHEFVAGILDDVWFITRDYTEPAFFIGFIVVHVVVIATGIRVLRRTLEPQPVHAASGELVRAG